MHCPIMSFCRGEKGGGVFASLNDTFFSIFSIHRRSSLELRHPGQYTIYLKISQTIHHIYHGKKNCTCIECVLQSHTIFYTNVFPRDTNVQYTQKCILHNEHAWRSSGFFVVVFFQGGHMKKNHTAQEKRYRYKFNENRDVCITKQNIYFR